MAPQRNDLGFEPQNAVINICECIISDADGTEKLCRNYLPCICLVKMSKTEIAKYMT